MKHVGTANNRVVFYQQHTLDVNWEKEMPKKNWLLVVVAENKHKNILREIINKALAHDLSYACCVGKQGELLHDMFDEEIVFRQVDFDKLYLPPHFIITTWHDDVEQGLWFSIFAAYNADVEINKVFCLNASDLKIEDNLIEVLQNKV